MGPTRERHLNRYFPDNLQIVSDHTQLSPLLESINLRSRLTKAPIGDSRASLTEKGPLVSLTPKQEAFATCIGLGMGYTQAYRQAYDVPLDCKAGWLRREACKMGQRPDS